MFQLRDYGSALVCIDRANIWKSKVDLQWLYTFLRLHPQIGDINFYFGTDTTRQSRNFLHKTDKLGYHIVTKEVKYIDIAPYTKVRKADFDVEIAKDMLLSTHIYNHYIVFCGDGDLRCVYDYLLTLGKKLTVIHLNRGLGREIHDLRNTIEIFNMDYFLMKAQYQ